MPLVKYRLHGNRPPPQVIKLPVPGWGGEPQPRRDGNHEQPWHCMPFSEGARYGMELIYPFKEELRIYWRDGRIVLDAEWGPPGDPDMMWPPFRTFGEDYYSYQLSLDLLPPPGWAIRTEPHPRFYTDPTNTTPLAVPALIRVEWWPMMFFCIFKAPPKGTTHIFREGEPFISMIVIPDEPELALAPMLQDECAEREMRARRIAANRDALAMTEGSHWTSSTRTIFDGTYRRMTGAAKKKGRSA
jgi:hypothetical protein